MRNGGIYRCHRVLLCGYEYIFCIRSAYIRIYIYIYASCVSHKPHVVNAAGFISITSERQHCFELAAVCAYEQNSKWVLETPRRTCVSITMTSFCCMYTAVVVVVPRDRLYGQSSKKTRPYRRSTQRCICGSTAVAVRYTIIVGSTPREKVTNNEPSVLFCMQMEAATTGSCCCCVVMRVSCPKNAGRYYCSKVCKYSHSNAQQFSLNTF